MADNTRGGSNDGTLPLIATDDVGGVHYQRVKLDIGGDGLTVPVTAAAPVPVVQTGTPALPTGAATEATLDTRTGALTETAPTTDTASSGINGRLQRIAQRLTSLIAVFTVGAGTEAAAVRVTLPTDGTGKVNAAQSGTWTVQPGNTANTTAWKVDGSAVTQPVSGTVATTNADLTTLAGAIKNEDVASANADPGMVVHARRTAAPANTSGTDLDYEPLQVSAGRLWTSATVDAALPAGTNNIGDVDVLTVPSPLSTAGNGTAATAHRVTIASDSTGVIGVTDNAGSLTVDGTVTASIAAGATTIAKAEDVASADADVGVPAMAVRKASPANTSGTDGDYEMLQMSAGRVWASATIDAAIPAGTNNIGDVDIVSVPAPLSTTGNGTAATAHRVTLASDSTGQVALAAGTNGIGKLTANSGVDIGDVDVTTVGTITPGTAATSLGKAEDAVHASGDVGVMALAVRNGANTGLAADGDYIPLTTDSNGSLWVTISDTLGIVPVTIDSGTVDVSSVNPGTSGPSLGKAEDAAHGSGDAGVAIFGVRTDTPSQRAGTDGDYTTINTNVDGGLWVTEAASVAGGTDVYKSLDLDETEEEVKGTAATLYGWFITNRRTSPVYVKFYNATAANVTVGTTTPVMTFEIPGNSTDHIAANMAFAPGIKFGTALTFAATTGLADNDTGAPAANDVIANVFYK